VDFTCSFEKRVDNSEKTETFGFDTTWTYCERFEGTCSRRRMEQVDCQRMEDKEVLHTADELIDFVELYNGKRKSHSI